MSDYLEQRKKVMFPTIFLFHKVKTLHKGIFMILAHLHCRTMSELSCSMSWASQLHFMPTITNKALQIANPMKPQTSHFNQFFTNSNYTVNTANNTLEYTKPLSTNLQRVP